MAAQSESPELTSLNMLQSIEGVDVVPGGVELAGGGVVVPVPVVPVGVGVETLKSQLAAAVTDLLSVTVTLKLLSPEEV